MKIEKVMVEGYYKGDAVEYDEECLYHGLAAWVVIHLLLPV